MRTPLGYLLFILGLLLSLPLIFILFLIPKIPISSVATIYLLGGITVTIGLLCAPWWQRWSWTLIIAGSLLTFATITIRILFPPTGSGVTMITLPDQSGPRAANRLIDERDAVLFGAWLSPYIRFVSPAEADSLIPTFSRTYDEMHSHGVTPLSPFITTYLNQQHPNKFDAVIAEPESDTPPTTGIIFLHGFGGNFTVQCWLVARSGYSIDAVTVCPSTSVNGHWWNEKGKAILEETRAYLHQRGVKRIYLAGLSNGGIGASLLADQFKEDIAGLILISGADPTAVITDLPVLVIHGEGDERIPVSMIEKYVEVSGSNATYHLFDGDHFLLLKQAEQVQGAIADWLIEQESRSHAQ